jgi:release factor glutamine methyltransferase
MMTVLEAIRLATDYFEKKTIESPRINAELLLADVLKCKRLDLYLKFDRPLQESEVDKYREFIARRGKFEPMQYITGYTEFYGMQFKVNPDVLIPRPETEILIETIINHHKTKTNLSILDIGTGSGNIPISLSVNLPQSRILSVDISEKAINIARENSVFNNINGSLDFKLVDVFDDVILNESSFDVIVSNPPYVSAVEYPDLQKEIIEHEPKIAVTDGDDGLKYYRRIAFVAAKILANNGILYLEIGKEQHGPVKTILEENNFAEIGIVKDYQQIERVIFGIKK